MKFALLRTSLVFLSTVLLLSSFPIQTPAQKSRMQDASRHARTASDAFTEIMNIRENTIPKELLDKCEAIAVFPDVIKAAFIFGGKGGHGVISRRIRGGWSAPVFFNLTGGSFGAQIGATKTDYVLLIMNDAGVNGLLKDKFEIGGEVGVAAGPVGREASASTDAMLQAGILSYSRSKGAFLGAALKGAAITPDNDLNESVYGKKASELLTGRNPIKLADMPPAVRIFPRTLARYSIK
ncbi:MAG TPA: lipid-binding SYLF domain-containing protein [Pyrinomonadaceae bacterium]|nr:lipid-binding SYLF domain-containing protein [Pyrinomonadaceae bacterium]